MEETHHPNKWVEQRMHPKMDWRVLSIDVVLRHAVVFAGLPFGCEILIYVDLNWWFLLRQFQDEGQHWLIDRLVKV